MSALPLCALLLLALLPTEEAAAQADSTSVDVTAADTTVAPLSIETDRTVYGPFDTVTVTFTSRLEGTVYLMPGGCRTLDGNPLPLIRFERLEGERWVPYSPGSTCGGAVQEPASIQPSEPYRVRFQVGLFSPLPLGTYRYVFSIREDALQPETQVPDSVATSNAFEVAV